MCKYDTNNVCFDWKNHTQILPLENFMNVITHWTCICTMLSSKSEESFQIYCRCATCEGNQKPIVIFSIKPPRHAAKEITILPLQPALRKRSAVLGLVSSARAWWVHEKIANVDYRVARACRIVVCNLYVHLPIVICPIGLGTSNIPSLAHIFVFQVKSVLLFCHNRPNFIQFSYVY